MGDQQRDEERGPARGPSRVPGRRVQLTDERTGEQIRTAADRPDTHAAERVRSRLDQGEEEG